MADRRANVPNIIHDILLQAFKGKMSDDAEDEPEYPPPPSEEIKQSEAVILDNFTTENIQLERGMVILKGNVSTEEVLGTDKTDLVPGKYEGGLKLWECCIDLIEAVRREVQDGHLAFRGKDVLELGCGHGLPGIVACVKGAARVHFQDYNKEVLTHLTIPNVNANLKVVSERLAKLKQLNSEGGFLKTPPPETTEVKFFAGDWGEIGDVLLKASSTAHNRKSLDLKDSPFKKSGGDRRKGSESSGLERTTSAVRFAESDTVHLDSNGDKENAILEEGSVQKIDEGESDQNSLAYHRVLAGTPSFCSRDEAAADSEGDGYDVILMSETVYSPYSLEKLLDLIKKCLRQPYGVVYLAGKKHYFGVGGGTRQFKSLVEEDGLLHSHLLAEFADGSSNVREVWKFFYKT